MGQCVKFHFLVNPDFQSESGSTLMQNNRIGFGIHNREPPLKFFKKFLKVDPDCRSRIRIMVPDRNREPFREPFFQNRERESRLTYKLQKFAFHELLRHQIFGNDKSGITMKKPFPKRFPIPIGNQNFAHCIHLKNGIQLIQFLTVGHYQTFLAIFR